MDDWTVEDAIKVRGLGVLRNGSFDYKTKGITQKDLLVETLQNYLYSIQLIPQYGSIFQRIGIAIGRLGNYNDELRYYDKAIEINNQCYLAYYKRGILMMRREKILGSFRLHQGHRFGSKEYTGIQLKRPSQILTMSLNQILISLPIMHRFIITEDFFISKWEIRTSYQMLIEELLNQILKILKVLQQRQLFILYLIGMIFKEIDEQDKALIDYNKAIQLNLNKAAFYFHRWILYNKIGNKYLSLSLSNYNQAIDLDPNDFQAYYNRGYQYIILNRSPFTQQ
ncbi:unnamed protein product [Paramecium octaurelia]|uniref:Tetratricopeptide repeat protein n=1 Tax=Paramecium octaurelia TaxID=43137 RepID=A0A8S1YH41_PAROT|nr:unnamed protein product [Paramecium octaurelia]